MTNIIEQLDSEQIKTDIPDFAPGDTVRVQVKVKEGSRERLQAVSYTHLTLPTTRGGG